MEKDLQSRHKQLVQAAGLPWSRPSAANSWRSRKGRGLLQLGAKPEPCAKAGSASTPLASPCPLAAEQPQPSKQEPVRRIIHSSKLTWKWRGAHYKATVPYIGPSMSFHVDLGEGTSPHHPKGTWLHEKDFGQKAS